jgi:ElaB/YqjD/DUF883 family membrane-anchored ribosome-binding protein
MGKSFSNLSNSLSNSTHTSELKEGAMENSISNSLVTGSQKIADKTADKVQTGIRDARDAAEEAGSTLSIKVEDLRSDAGPAIQRVIGRVQSVSRQSVDAIGDMASTVRDAASNTSDAIVAYTKKNPANALAIAAASGALLYAVIKALRSSRAEASRARFS